MQTSSEIDLFAQSSQAIPSQAIPSRAIPSQTTPSPAVQQTLNHYFQALNSEAFDAAAQLFSPEGKLIPPFSSPIQGHEAIAAYLKKEAIGITLSPQSWETMPAASESDNSHGSDRPQHYRIQGKVKTSLFTVNVAWLFTLNREALIDTVEVKLLASMKELMAIQTQR